LVIGKTPTNLVSILTSSNSTKAKGAAISAGMDTKMVPTTSLNYSSPTARLSHGLGTSSPGTAECRSAARPVAANSQDQLRDTIWPEIGKWHRQLPEALKAMIPSAVRAPPIGAMGGKEVTRWDA
jgi:hypothetical protein